MVAALPFILFCLAFLVVAVMRARRSDEPLPTLGMVGIQLLRIQVYGFVAALVVGFFAGAELAAAVFFAGQAWAVLTLLLHGLNVVLSRR